MPLHDDPAAVGNLTDADYLATYDDPGTTGGHVVPPGVLEQVMAELDAHAEHPDD